MSLPGYSPAVNFQEILDKARKTPVKPQLVRQITPQEFITRNIKANYEQQKELIALFMGEYNPRKPFGVQLDNARHIAAGMLRAEPKATVLDQRRISPSLPGSVTEALKVARDAQRRIDLLSSDDSSAPTEAIKSSLNEQLEGALNVVSAYKDSIS
jgi:hypothetical protein